MSNIFNTSIAAIASPRPATLACRPKCRIRKVPRFALKWTQKWLKKTLLKHIFEKGLRSNFSILTLDTVCEIQLITNIFVPFFNCLTLSNLNEKISTLRENIQLWQHDKSN